MKLSQGRSRAKLSWRITALAVMATSVANANSGTSSVQIYSNREDIQFFVRSGKRLFQIAGDSKMGPHKGGALNEWTFHPEILRSALQSQFDLSTDQVEFSQLCAHARLKNAGDKEYCRVLGSITVGDSIHYNFFDETRRFDTEGTAILILNSPGAIVGSENYVNQHINVP